GGLGEELAAAGLAGLQPHDQVPLFGLEGLDALNVGRHQQATLASKQIEQVVLRRREFVQQRRNVGFPALVFHQDQRCWRLKSSNIGPVNWLALASLSRSARI